MDVTTKIQTLHTNTDKRFTFNKKKKEKKESKTQ